MSSSKLDCRKVSHSRTPAKHPRKPKRPSPQTAFRFRDLPLEMRNEIYHLCFTVDGKIAIEVKPFYDAGTTKLELAYSCHNSTSNQTSLDYDWESEKSRLNLGLLFVNKATSREALTVLYGFDEFKFHGRYSWSNLKGFLSSLRNSSCVFLRRLDLEFPQILRYEEGLTVDARDFPEHVQKCMRVIALLPKLERLTFRVYDDIVSSDLERTRWISKYQGKSKVTLEMKKAWPRTIRISAAVVDLIHDLNLTVVGKFQTVAPGLRCENEVRWLRWLEAEDI